jgi:hypothetical protein
MCGVCGVGVGVCGVGVGVCATGNGGEQRMKFL